ncbi:metal-dependent hydrolase [Novimethylophilus kurashikiensis]|uniref:Metal-dependent hydrolase n=1 Tax=Novimethylophilus kurashikiensis TaxID=1825523 RepID=A0A2R5F500_9PROT|nr:YgjP-like metallopeptidase domain-containing protein [Novimethylophilus kurashikiensis]GBG12768.1 metal-dependent hydrolase [Novimethylophilus kurashikiensis]
MKAVSTPNYLAGYPISLVDQVHQLIAQDRLGDILLKKYPQAHTVRTDRALYDYVHEIKAEYLRNAGQLSKVEYDNKIHVIRNALGTHTSVSRVQGSKLKTKREIRVATMFRTMPGEFLRMIVVHELAHIKEREHDKAFYQLCQHMEPDYHQLEFDLRVYLTYLETTGKSLWSVEAVSSVDKA